MGFGNIGIGELMVILLVVMIVFGPKRLPEIARNMGKFMRDFRRETSAAITELKQGIEPINVGIFDEPDAGTATAMPNGETAPMPGVAAAGGAGTVPPTERPVAYQNTGNGGGRARAKPKPRAKKAKTPAAARSPAPKRKTATSSKKRPASKAKRPAARSGGTRKR